MDENTTQKTGPERVLDDLNSAIAMVAIHAGLGTYGDLDFETSVTLFSKLGEVFEDAFKRVEAGEYK